MSDLTRMSSRTSPFLRRVLLADAATSGATGLLMMLGAGAAGELLAVPDALLRYAGLTLLPFAALVALLATRENLWRAGVWAVVVCNALWAADCVLLLLTGWIEPNELGIAFIVAQALVVAVFAELEYLGLRRSDGARRMMFPSNDSSVV
ncbi:MAG TPA: hypothetical protein VMM27_09385 [Casimicrobiaceae bacterium]|nr:hypothetical protein [Casimicrobiaceae bacterium]